MNKKTYQVVDVTHTFFNFIQKCYKYLQKYLFVSLFEYNLL